MRGPSVPEVQKDVVPIEDTRKLLLGLDRRKEYRDAALISVLAETGMRVTEAISVLWSDVSWSEQTISLTETKNGSVRIVPFGPQTGRRLDLLNRKRTDKMVAWVFEGRYGRPLTRSGALQLVKKHFRQYGITGISPHDLRHSMATAFMDANPDGEATLQAVGGWHSRTMVTRYSRLGSDKRAREDFRRRSPTSDL
jgi:integrase/recombinase XerD